MVLCIVYSACHSLVVVLILIQFFYLFITIELVLVVNRISTVLFTTPLISDSFLV